MSGAVLNLAVAAGIWFARRGMPPETATGRRPGGAAPLWHAHRQVWTWSGLAFLSGFLVIALEIVWFRLLGVLMQSNAYAFSLVLAVFLMGDALGIVAGAFLAPRVRDLRRLFLCLQGAMAASALLAVLALHLAHYALGGFIAFETGYYDTIPRLLAIMALTVLMVFPPAFLLGMSFPITQRAVQDDPALVGQRVGTIQLFNILGNAAGALVTGLLLPPLAGRLRHAPPDRPRQPGAPAAAPPRRQPAPARNGPWQPPSPPWSSCSPATSSFGAGCTVPVSLSTPSSPRTAPASPSSARRRRGGQAGGSISAATPTAASLSALSRVPWERWACWSTRTRGRC